MKSNVFDIANQRKMLLRALSDLQKQQDASGKIGLILLDVHDFRRLNAAYGYSGGNLMLEQVADRLAHLFAPKKTSVFRIGNDEFAIVLPRVLHSELLAVAANKVMQALQAPVKIDDEIVKINVNLGAAVAELNASFDPERLLIKAERTLAQAREQGVNYILDQEIRENDVAVDIAYEQELHDAISTHSLELYYQPKIDLFSHIPEDVEALVRWPHPTKGIIGPDLFLPIVDRIGRYEDLTKFVLHTALRQRNEWPIEDARVAINLPASMVHEATLPDMVTSALRIWGAHPSYLTLEITEGAIIRDHLASKKHLAKLKGMGVRISIDDFGTGYSSLAYFKKLPASELKIDKSFVANLCTNADDHHVVQLIIDLAHHFGLKVIAEGVEDKDTLHALMSMQCDSVQGFYFAKAMPHERLIEWIESYQSETYFN
ncbi:MAG TPA: bifunctional diguanylate cyclase/phosphodiesterase [Pseudomonadales bacterium]|nr:bifunctional diguanylate cyclase/phosphodiesterase [Pseudomonadales bacterium]